MLWASVEAAVDQDVDFGGFQNPDALDPRIQLVDTVNLFAKPRFGQSVRDLERLGMISDGNVLIAKFAGGSCHFFDRLAAIA